MHFEVIAANELTADQLEAWSTIQLADPKLCNPFFRPEFTQTVAAIRSDVETAILMDGGEAVGFLPFHRDRHGVGRVVAHTVSDVHGPVLKAGSAWNMRDFLAQTGLKSLHYFSMPMTMTDFRPYHYGTSVCPVMDLSAGFDGYCRSRKEAGSDLIGQTQRKARKLEREVGKLRLAVHTDDPLAFEAMMTWKISQCVRTNYMNVLRHPWVVDLLRRLMQTRTDHFAGLLSALYVNHQVVAVHMGLRSDTVLDWWFPAYDVTLSKYSPGAVLLIRLAEELSKQGVRRIDLGVGGERYKGSMANEVVQLAHGSVDQSWWRRTIRKNKVRAKDYVKSLPPDGTAMRWARRVHGLIAPP